MRKQLVLTASGRDRPGILEELTALIVRFSGNIEASRMARMGGDFAMLMFISAPEETIDRLGAAFGELEDARFDIQTRLSVVREGPEDTGTRACAITVLGADHLGIIHQVARYLSQQGINIETMSTEVGAAPMSGTPLFTMSAVVRLPSTLSVDDLRDALDFIGDEVGVDTKVFTEPAELVTGTAGGE